MMCKFNKNEKSGLLNIMLYSNNRFVFIIS